VSAFSPRILKNASRQLKKLDPPVAKRIVKQIACLAEHFDKIKSWTTKANLPGVTSALRRESGHGPRRCGPQTATYVLGVIGH